MATLFSISPNNRLDAHLTKYESQIQKIIKNKQQQFKPHSMEDEILRPSSLYYRNSITTSVADSKLNRKCTDFTCITIYFTILLSCIALSLWYAPQKYPYSLTPHDKNHQPCRYPYKYLYFPISGSSASLCVSDCPRRKGIPLNCKPNKDFTNCPTSISGIIVNEVENTCYQMGTKQKNSNKLKTFLKLVIQHQSTIIQVAIYVSIASFIIIVLILLMPQIMTYLCIILLDLVLIGMALVGFYGYFHSNTYFRKYLPYHFKSSGKLIIASVILFVIGFLSLLSICFNTLKSRQISFMVIIIRLARISIINHLYFPLIAAILNALAIGTFYLSIEALKNALALVVLDPMKQDPHNQFVLTTQGTIICILLLILYLWTHGFMVSLTHWLFQVIITFWYHSPSQKLYGLSPLFSTLRLTGIHIGTIFYGAYYPYYSQSLSNFANNVQANCNVGFYNCFCCIHNCCCRYLHIYSFIQTALKSLSFWASNIEFYHLRMRMRVNFPSLYMLGYFLSRSTKNLIIFCGMVFLYWSLVTLQPEIFRSIWHLIPALLIGWFLLVEVVTPWTDLVGLLSDTLTINYYMENQYNMASGLPSQFLQCPPKVLDLLQQVEISL